MATGDRTGTIVVLSPQCRYTHSSLGLTVIHWNPRMIHKDHQALPVFSEAIEMFGPFRMQIGFGQFRFELLFHGIKGFWQ